MNTSSHESILDSLPCGLCVVDGDGRILSTNPALEQLLGWHSAEWRGQPLSLYLEQTILDPAQVPRWTQALNLALALSRTTQLTLPTRFRVGPDDAASVSITGIVTPWQEDNTAQSGALVIFHDSARQTDLAGAEARFLAVLSHELSTPVTNLTAATDLLAQRLGADDKMLWRLLQVIRNEATHLRRILAQFPMTLSADREPPQPRTRLVTLRPVLRQVAYAFGARELDCQIEVQVPPDLPFVWSDEEQIRQILSKLVDNAIRYAPPGSLIVLAADKRGDEIVVSVRDRGPGIVKEDEELIFEPWHRGRQEDPAAEHQGLGLSMARTLVQSLGGRLWHEERPAGGANFCFSLPCAQGLPDRENEEKEHESHYSDH